MAKESNQNRHSSMEKIDNSPIEPYKSEEKYKPFSESSFFLFIYKKTEKLSNALFLLTSFFPENEPLRNDLRISARDLLNCLIKTNTLDRGQVAPMNSFKGKCLYTLSLVEAGYYGGVVSRMNLDVFTREFMNLIKVIDKNSASADSFDQSLGREFFFVPELKQPEKDASKYFAEPPQDKRELPEKSAPSKYQKDISKGQNNNDSEYVDRARIKTQDKKGKDLTVPDKKKNERRAIIIDLVRRKGEVSIKEVSQAISGCSEKTVQRELGALARKGVLKKEGERRWSRYSLV